MSSILSLGFEYKGSYHSFLARIKEAGQKTEYHITVMNGELEKLLYGNHVISDIDGQLGNNANSATTEQELLKTQIAKSLHQYLNEQSLSDAAH